MIIIVIIAIFLLIILAIFAFPQLSPIPYFPSNKKDLPLIIKALRLKNKQVVIDLGAGDGVIIFSAAKKAYENKLYTKFIAVDINPVLLLIMHIRRFFHPNKKNIKIMYGDMFNLTIQPYNNLTIYLYISPWYLEEVISNLIPIRSGSNFSIVSYMYPIKSLKKQEKIIKGNEHDIFVYNI